MKKNSFTEMFYKNAGYIVVVLISIVYVASSLINISKSGKSVYEIIGAGVLSLIVGIMINGVFRSMGVRRGDEDERTVATNALHAKTVDEISPHIDKLDDFCEKENKRALKEIRTRILAREGLKYSDYFDSDGNAMENAKCKMQNAKLIQQEGVAGAPDCLLNAKCKMQNAKLIQQEGVAGASDCLLNAKCKMQNAKLTTIPSPSGDTSHQREPRPSQLGSGSPDTVGAKRALKAKKKAYFKALRVKVKPLVSSNLTSDGVKASDPFDFGKSKKEYTAQRSVSDAAIKIIMAVIFGYFGVSLASEINVASIIWNALQIVLYVTGGVIQMYSSYMWVVDDYRGSVIKKIDCLQKFKSHCAACIKTEDTPN